SRGTRRAEELSSGRAPPKSLLAHRRSHSEAGNHRHGRVQRTHGVHDDQAAAVDDRLAIAELLSFPTEWVVKTAAVPWSRICPTMSRTFRRDRCHGPEQLVA